MPVPAGHLSRATRRPLPLAIAAVASATTPSLRSDQPRQGQLELRRAQTQNVIEDRAECPERLRLCWLRAVLGRWVLAGFELGVGKCWGGQSRRDAFVALDTTELL